MFNYMNVGFVQNRPYEEKIHAKELGYGVRDCVMTNDDFIYDEDNHRVGWGRAIMGGTPVRLGSTGEYFDLPVGYSGPVTLKRVLNGTLSTVEMVMEAPGVNDDATYYFKLYDITTGVVSQDYRSIDWVHSFSTIDMGDGTYIFELNGYKSNPITIAEVTNTVVRIDLDTTLYPPSGINGKYTYADIVNYFSNKYVAVDNSQNELFGIGNYGIIEVITGGDTIEVRLMAHGGSQFVYKLFENSYIGTPDDELDPDGWFQMVDFYPQVRSYEISTGSGVSVYMERDIYWNDGFTIEIDSFINTSSLVKTDTLQMAIRLSDGTFLTLTGLVAEFYNGTYIDNGFSGTAIATLARGVGIGTASHKFVKSNGSNYGADFMVGSGVYSDNIDNQATMGQSTVYSGATPTDDIFIERLDFSCNSESGTTTLNVKVADSSGITIKTSSIPYPTMVDISDNMELPEVGTND